MEQMEEAHHRWQPYVNALLRSTVKQRNCYCSVNVLPTISCLFSSFAPTVIFKICFGARLARLVSARPSMREVPVEFDPRWHHFLVPDSLLCSCNYCSFTAVTTNTHPQRVFSSVQTCVLVDVNQPLPWFFTRWPREDSFFVSWALGRICRRFSRFCNILLQDLTPLHVKITRRKNLLSVSRRKLKVSTYIFTHCKLQPHKLSQSLATRLRSC